MSRRSTRAGRAIIHLKNYREKLPTNIKTQTMTALSESANHNCKVGDGKTCEHTHCKDLVRRFFREANTCGRNKTCSGEYGFDGDKYCAQGERTACSEVDLYSFCYVIGARRTPDPWTVTMQDLLLSDADAGKASAAERKRVGSLLHRICLLYAADYECLGGMEPPAAIFVEGTGSRCELRPAFRD